MTHSNAIRFLAHQAKLCRDRDSCEALCLLLPAIMRIFELEQMEEVEAAAFKYEFKGKLNQLPFQDEADRAAQARPAVPLAGKGLFGSPGIDRDLAQAMQR